MKNLLLTAAIASLLVTFGAACTQSEPSTDDSVSTESMPSDTDEDATAQTNLLTYDGSAQNIPVSAQYPDTIEVDASASGEGVGVFFNFEPQGNALDDAEISVFLPANTASTNDLMEFITGPNGLIENNDWSLDGSRADTASEFSYPWFEMVFDISTDFEQSGHILIGQSNGQAIQVVVLYPAEMADEFWPAANIVLESLEFDADLLPVTNSGV